ncbi:MAG: DnaA regulatory inactivator Hda [Gammaproteobacteria bacterium]|nr:DnaA regulatory inactivator Hda [Gammaproteobacteria bacterium]
MSKQLPLNISLRDFPSFENYVPGKNQEPVDRLKKLVTGTNEQEETDWLIYLWGASGCGKTHLLEAICRQAGHAGTNSLLVSLKRQSDNSPEVLEELSRIAVVCIDDVHCIAGSRDWETALFALCEQRRQTRQLLVLSANNNANYLGLSLPDLATRMAGWGLSFPLQGLDDEEKFAVVKQRARNRGIDVGDDVVRYVLNRYPRDMQALFKLLEQVDQCSLASQRRVTIPFLKTLELEDAR